jgi:hypothetical protein
MSDDLANVWGTNLVNMTKAEERFFGGYSKELELDEFKRLVSYHFDTKFLLQKVCQDGSTANLHAIIDATFGNTSCCYIAAGSYVSAADAVLQNLSTSEFALNSSFSIIRVPDALDAPFTKQQIVALPYYIIGTMDQCDAEKYENSCFRNLHEKCIIMRTKGTPIKCIMLELMLAGNGALLSDRALLQLAHLSTQHDFMFIIDEIMTGGRTGEMLYLQKKPSLFIERVSHVTLGKWIQVGIVLVSKQQQSINETIKRPTSTPRSSSTSIDLSNIIPIWNKVVIQLELTEWRRNETIKKLKCKEEEVWGEGCLIFAPCKNATITNLKCRYLPRLEKQSISSINLKPNTNKTITKTIINHLVIAAVIKWKQLNYYTEDDKEYIPLIRYLSKRRMIDDSLVIQTEVMQQKVIHCNKLKAGEMLRKLEQAGLLTYQVTGKQRLRSWIVLEDMSYQC